MKTARRLAAALLALAGCDGNLNKDEFPLAVTIRASVRSSGAQGDFASGGAVVRLSADGRYVVFDSVATNLVAGDTNAARDVFRHDLQTGVTELVSAGLSGAPANADSQAPSISDDGRYVCFESLATNLAPGGAGFSEIYVRDMVAGMTTRVSVDPGGGNANGGSTSAAISGNGRYVAFCSTATDLVAGFVSNNGAGSDVFRRDLQAPGATILVSRTLAGPAQGGNGVSCDPSISADGSVIAFASLAFDLAPNTSVGLMNIFVRDVGAGSTTLVFEFTDGESLEPSLSADGRFVAYHSYATNIVVPDNQSGYDVFLYDRTTGLTEMVSRNSSGVQQSGIDAWNASVSGDGRFVAFESGASNLVADDNNAALDIFVKDRATGGVTRVSVSTYGKASGIFENSFLPSISRDGRFVAFISASDDLVPGDTNGVDDVFVRGPLR
jgi:Tol biopolymer transport system component